MQALYRNTRKHFQGHFDIEETSPLNAQEGRLSFVKQLDKEVQELECDIQNGNTPTFDDFLEARLYYNI